jgi:SIR2-like domain
MTAQAPARPAPTHAVFLERLEAKVRQQLASRRVAYLLGAGASHLNGRGYALATNLWEEIKDLVPAQEGSEIQAKLEAGAEGLERALDLLDPGEVVEKPHRRLVTDAIARRFLQIAPPLAAHRQFVHRLSQRNEFSVPVLALNYDCLVEQAADSEGIQLVEGFAGIEERFFAPERFHDTVGQIFRGPRRRVQWRRGVVSLLKLHGSLNWFVLPSGEVRSLPLHTTVPDGAKRLMIPPQHRKAAESTTPPYASLWSEFRGLLRHGPNLANRLVVVGYGMQDEHVNVVIESALARNDFTLLVFSKSLSPAVLRRWVSRPRVTVVTQTVSFLYGEEGDGHPWLWDFERLALEV